jgi:predicted DCC family thiol-disulfide oxidoreductase YuxK
VDTYILPKPLTGIVYFQMADRIGRIFGARHRRRYPSQVVNVTHAG